MKISRVETLTCRAYPGVLWLQLRTDDGLVGLGETWAGVAAVEGYLHEVAAPRLIGQDPLAIEHHHDALVTESLRGMSHRGSGAENRGLSAIDIALWDILGQTVDLPIYRLLGGPSRPAIRLYNTCVADVRPGEPGLPGQQGPYANDWLAWQPGGDPAELAHDLLERGVTALKIWPFDTFALASRGQHITAEQIDEGIRPFRRIREAVGTKMDLALEMHTMWNLPAATRIVEAMDELRPMWYEDPIRLEDARTLATLASKTRVPITASEYLSGRYAFREYLEQGGIGVAMFDPGFVGGVTEARRVAHLAEAFHRPFAPHDCVGPVVFTVGVHLTVALPNAMIQEGVRAHYDGGWYTRILTDLPRVERGYASPPPGPGLGTRLLPDFRERPDVVVRGSP
jgi:L-alanine-DL-glutamate epimerase-like enolase superfamily enzyme